MQSTDNPTSSLTFDTYDMTAGETAKRRGQLEREGWVFSHEIRTLDTFKRVHVHLLFRRTVQAGEYPADDAVSNFNESDEPRPRGLSTLGYVLIVGALFTGYVLFHPERQVTVIGSGVAVGMREMVIPAVGVVRPKNSNAARPVPVRNKRKTPKKISQNELPTAGFGSLAPN